MNFQSELTITMNLDGFAKMPLKKDISVYVNGAAVPSRLLRVNKKDRTVTAPLPQKPGEYGWFIKVDVGNDMVRRSDVVNTVAMLNGGILIEGWF